LAEDGLTFSAPFSPFPRPIRQDSPDAQAAGEIRDVFTPPDVNTSLSSMF